MQERSKSSLDATRSLPEPNEADELARLKSSALNSARDLNRSLRRLDRVVRSAGRDTISGLLPAAALAVYRVLEAYGCDPVARGASADRLRSASTISDAIEACGVRSRQIVLPAEWWLADHGHIIGELRETGTEGSSSKAVPVALVRSHRGRYYMVDPETGARTAVTAKLASRIAPYAFEVVPNLPQRVDNLVDLARHVLPMMHGDMTWIILAGALGGFFGALLPIATALVIDTLIPGQEISLLIQVGVALLLVALVNLAFSLTQQLALIRIGGRSGMVVDAAIWDRVLKLPASFFKSYSSGDLSARVSGISALRSAVVSVALSAVIAVVFSVFYLILMFLYDVRLALVAISLVLFLAGITVVVGLLQIKHYKRQIVISGWLSGYVFQILQAVVKLRIAGAEDRAFVLWADKFTDERAAVLSARRLNNHFAAFSDAYAILAMAVIFAATFHLSENRLTAGVFIAFLAAFGSFQGAFMALSHAALQLVAVWPDWERAKPIFKTEVEAVQRAADPGRLSGAIEVTNVTFGYDENAPILKDVCLSISAGEHVAIVGPSGAGKSTLIRILLCLEKPRQGTILYDGQDMAGLDPTLVRRQIGVVTQMGRLMAGSIMENIRGARDVSYEDCLEACRAAGLEDELKMFPMGLHTPLTEGGATLSGGQRQRLLIARALVSRPRILIFDEATSALDNRTQAIVTDSLNRLDVTRIIVAHRLSTIQQADRIFVLDKGQIVESGRYDDLVRAGGLFQQLAERQLS